MPTSPRLERGLLTPLLSISSSVPVLLCVTPTVTRKKTQPLGEAGKEAIKPVRVERRSFSCSEDLSLSVSSRLPVLFCALDLAACRLFLLVSLFKVLL